MANSEVDICNRALMRLGQTSIVALTDNSNPARACNSLYPAARDATLRAYPWGFAKARAVLPKREAASAWEGLNVYDIPGDCMYIHRIDIEDNNYKWKMEGRTIVTAATPPINILYIKKITEVPTMDELFVDTIVERLAADLSFPITRQAQLFDRFEKTYQVKLALARSIDSHEQSNDETISDVLRDVRLA